MSPNILSKFKSLEAAGKNKQPKNKQKIMLIYRLYGVKILNNWKMKNLSKIILRFINYPH